MITDNYPDAVRGILNHLETTEISAIEKAAGLIAESLTHGGAVYCSEIGHNNQHDFFHRSGGLAALQLFSYRINVEAPIAKCLENRPRAADVDADRETARFAVRNSNLRPGDVMLLSSVSGKGKSPIELSLACREMGVKVIGFTSMQYTNNVEAVHSSGKKLFEVVDLAIDIGAPYGDSAVTIPGIDVKVLPVSGIAMITAGWMIWGKAMERLAAAGTPPAVFISINGEGGKEHHDRTDRLYQTRGF